jgi:AraC-like DNA-binding protein
MEYILFEILAELVLVSFLIFAFAFFAARRRKEKRTEGREYTQEIHSRPNSAPSPLLTIWEEEKPLSADFTIEMDRSQGQDPYPPYPDMRETCLIEELALSMRATGIIKRSHQLLSLYHMRSLSGHQPPPKIQPRVPLSIDSQELAAQINRKLDIEKVYLDEELTLSSFAHELNLEPHQLSRFLNNHLHSTFTQLISTYRVNEAKALLEDAPSHTILDIAFASGFNSKASFNRIFKRAMGMTPSEYRLMMRGRHAFKNGL